MYKWVQVRFQLSRIPYFILTLLTTSNGMASPCSDDDYFVDPPTRSPSPTRSPLKIVNPTKKRRSEVVAKKSKPADIKEEEIPHQWTTKQIRTLIQIRLSDSIDRKFRTTKKSHKHIWLAVSAKLKALGIDVSHIQAQNKYSKLRREYTKRYQKVNKSGADRTPLYEWEFYEDLEPSFRSCRQIAPDHVESSQPRPTSTSTSSSETTEGGEATETDGQEPGAASSSTPLVFPNRRRKRPLTQDDREDLADKRFQLMIDELRKTDKLIADYTAEYKETASAKRRLYSMQTELAAAQLAALRANQQ